MNPTDFPQANMQLTKPPEMTDEECSSLSVCNTGEELISCWQPTDEERIAIFQGQPIWLRIVGVRHPPVGLQVDTPFISHEHIIVAGKCIMPSCGFGA